MATKTKTNKSNRGRPRKDFSNIKIKKEESNIKRPRGRPRKEKNIKETVNTKISKHSKDINKLSKENEKIQLEVKETSFSSRKVWENKRSDNFALGLLIFSMLLFIFSLYKTFYSNNDVKPNLVSNRIINEQINQVNEDVQVDNEEINDEQIKIEIEVQEKDWEITGETKEVSGEAEAETPDYEIINEFYNTLNNKEFVKLSSLVDSYLKSSNVYKTYYSNNWLTKFTEKLANKKVYLMGIKEINSENKKDNVTHYSYILKYKLNNSNELFKEEREASIVTRWDKKLIWSLRCVTVWCSKMPFFNLPRYEK